MRRVVTVLLLGLVLVGCGSSGAPESFTDQPGQLPEALRPFANELVGTEDANAVPLVQRNFLEGCMSGTTARLDSLSGSDLATVCGCSYDSLVGYLVANTATPEEAFSTFLAIDDAVSSEQAADGAAPINENYLALFQACRDQLG